MEEEKKEKEKEQEYQLVQVPTQHTIAVQTPSGEIVSTEEAIVQILNIVVELKKNLG